MNGVSNGVIDSEMVCRADSHWGSFIANTIAIIATNATPAVIPSISATPRPSPSDS